MISQTIASGSSSSKVDANPENPDESTKTRSTGLLTPSRMALIVVLAHVPMLIVFCQQLWLKPHYQFFPVLAAAAAWLAWTRYGELPQPLGKSGPNFGGYLLILSVLLLIASSLLFSPWLCAISFWISLAGLSLWFGGFRFFRVMSGPLVLLLLIIPPPNNLDVAMVKRLQGLAVNSSSRILDKLKVTHLVAGNVLELPSKKLLVEEACSGINSLLSVSAFTLCFAIWTRRGVFHTLILLSFAAFFVVSLNIVRISLGAVLEFRMHYDILTGWRHETIGLVLFAICLGLVFSLDQLLRFPVDVVRAWKAGLLFGLPIEARMAGENLSMSQLIQSEKTDPYPPLSGSPRPWRASRLAWFAALAFAMILAADGILVGKTYGGRVLTPTDARELYGNLREPESFQLPDDLAGWKRVEGEAKPIERSETIGQFSKTWHYTNGRLQAAVALDFPFPRWHELPDCYVSNGWSVESRKIIQVGSDVMPCVESEMKSSLAINGDLIWGIINQQGKWLTPENYKPVPNAPNAGFISGIFERFIKPLEASFRPDFDTYEVGKPALYQVQAFLPTFGYGEITANERKAFYDLYRAAGEALADQITNAR